MSEKYLGEVSTPLLINQIKENCAQKRTTLPIASVDELGHIYQYMGATSGSLVHGYFYECVSDGQNPATYSWQQVNTQPTPATPTASGTTFDNTTSGLQATNVQDAIDEVVDDLGTAASKDFTTNVAPNNHALVESNAVYSAINNALTSVYTPRGNIACADLTSSLLIASNVGNVYNTTDSGTTTALFMQGAGIPIPQNSTVGIIQTSPNTYLFNLMGNTIDLHDYQKQDLTQAIEGETTVEGALNALSTDKATQTEVNDIVNVLGAKNFVPYPYQQVKSSNGITWTDNGDGSVTANGTATANSWIIFTASTANPVEIPKSIKELVGKEVIMSSGEYQTGIGIRIDFYDAQLTELFYADTSTIATRKFTIPSDSAYMAFQAFVLSGVTASNVTIYPMLRLASDPDSTYAPYAMTNRQLTVENEALTNNINVNGSKNVLASLTPSGTYLGITISRNESGDIVVNGTATTSPTTISLFDRTFKHIGEATILRFTDLGIDKTKKYVFSRAEKVSNLRYNIRVMNGTTQVAEIELGNNDGLYTVIDFSQYTCDGLKADIVVTNGTTITNKVFSAMLCLESDYDLDPTYQPYAKTNRKLTEKIDIVGNLFTTTTKVVDNITHGIATTVATLENLPIGTYVVSGQFNSDSAMSGGGLVQFVSSGVIQNGASCNTMINQGFKANAGLTGIFNVTNATNQINLQIYTANADLTVVSVKLAAIRIA